MYIFYLYIPVALLSILLNNSIIIRHDVDDKDYIIEGQKYQDYICNLNLIEDTPDGMGTFIDSNWILTAAHCAEVILKKREGGKEHFIQFRGSEYAVSVVAIHPDYWEDGAYDLALVQIDRVPKDIMISPLYKYKDELDQQVLVVGFGDFGTGKTGPTGNDGLLRAGSNKVDEATDYWLKWIFDDPDSPNATPLEAISGPGDSGGPAFIEKDGQLFLAGVGSGQSTVATNGKEGLYGVREYYVRVSMYYDWVSQTLASHKARSRIRKNIKSFSRYYMNAEYDSLAILYAEDGKIMPPGSDIVSGREAIIKRWILPEGAKVLQHQVEPEEIRIMGDHAYDYGLFKGRTRKANGKEVNWQGKYVIVWKNENGDWKIYLDIWNSR